MTPEQEQRVKELLDLRNELTRKNVNHRAAKYKCNNRIDELTKAINLEKLDIEKRNKLINENQMKLEEAGREIQTITGQSIIICKSK